MESLGGLATPPLSRSMSAIVRWHLVEGEAASSALLAIGCPATVEAMPVGTGCRTVFDKRADHPDPRDRGPLPPHRLALVRRPHVRAHPRIAASREARCRPLNKGNATNFHQPAAHLSASGCRRIIGRELGRQQDQIELIASENIVSRGVLDRPGLGAHQQVCRGLSRAALLWRLRVRRRGRDDRDRARQAAVRRRLRQRPAAFRRAGQPGRLPRPAPARRPDHGHVARPWRPPDPRLAGHHVGQVVRRRRLRGAGDDQRIDMEEVRGAARWRPAEADRRRRLGLSARHRLRRVPRDRRRGRRVPDGRHGALCRPRRRPAHYPTRCRTRMW